MELIEDSISSLLPFFQGISHEFLVWENGTISEMYLKNDSFFKYYFGNDNYGYGFGLNRLVEKSTGNILLIINPDTKLIKINFSEIIKLLDEPEIGVIGIQHLDVTGSVVSSTRSFPHLRFFLWDLFLLSSIFRNSKIFGRQFMTNKNHLVSFYTDVVVGSFMLMRIEDFRSINGFDERFFMYCEETDLCQRLFHLGKRAYFYSDAILIHDEGGSTPNLKFNVYNNHVSLNLYAIKHLPKLKSKLFILFNLISKLNRGLLYIVYSIITLNSDYTRKGILFLSIGFRSPFKYFKK